MLKKDLNYICFDFETTGLDVEKDEAIQIGIINFNHKFEITDKFSSYIKPQNFNQLQNLSEIVEFTTGISLKQLENAPSFQDIEDKIKSFFNEKSVLIGHNINFDINFLKKYIGDFPYFEIFDTYIYSRLLLHFEASYALEILSDKYGFKGQSHDALADSIMSYELFKLLTKKLKKLIDKYPFLADILNKSDTIFSKIFELKNTNKNIFSIPKKRISVPKNKKISSLEDNLNNYPRATVFNIQNTSLEQAISFAINKQNKVILAFSSNARVHIAKKVLKEKLINFSALNLGYTLNEDKEKLLLSKNKLEKFESLYILKAFSHYADDLAIMDINNFDEYKVYNFLADKKREQNNNILLATHYELFKQIKEKGKEKLKNYTIVFFDWHYWMNSLSKVVNQSFDFYELINKLELLKYKLSYQNKDEEIEKIINQVSTFFGIIGSKLQVFFKGTNNKIELINMLNEPKNGLNQIKGAFENINSLIENLHQKLNNEDSKEIIEYWRIFKECAENYCTVEQKITFGGQLKYIFQALMENIDINIFNDFMKELNYYCFSSLDKENYKKLEDIVGKNKKSYESKTIIGGTYEEIIKNYIYDFLDNPDFKQLVENIRVCILNQESLFLVSNNKNFSNNLFKLIFNLFKEYNLNGNIYAENITGGQGKLLYYLQKDFGAKVVIGGPEFLINTQSKKIKFNKIFILALGGRQRKTMLEDLKFYLG